jgi:hypothetical protein
MPADLPQTPVLDSDPKALKIHVSKSMSAFEPDSSHANPGRFIFPIGHHLADSGRSPPQFSDSSAGVDGARVAGKVLKSRPLKNRSEKMKHQHLQYEVREVNIRRFVYGWRSGTP